MCACLCCHTTQEYLFVFMPGLCQMAVSVFPALAGLVVPVQKYCIGLVMVGTLARAVVPVPQWGSTGGVGHC